MKLDNSQFQAIFENVNSIFQYLAQRNFSRVCFDFLKDQLIEQSPLEPIMLLSFNLIQHQNITNGNVTDQQSDASNKFANQLLFRFFTETFCLAVKTHGFQMVTKAINHVN